MSNRVNVFNEVMAVINALKGSTIEVAINVYFIAAKTLATRHGVTEEELRSVFDRVMAGEGVTPREDLN